MAERIRHLKDFKVCRFCLDDVGPFTNIYEKDSRDGKQQIPLPLQIMACVAIEVFSNDGMPQLICNPCRSQTIGAYNFKTTCKKADDTLKLYLATGNRKLVKPLQKKRASSKQTSVLEHIVDQSQTLATKSKQPFLHTTPTTTITSISRPSVTTPHCNAPLRPPSPQYKRPKITATIQSIQSDDEHPDTETIHITMETDPLASTDEILPTAPSNNNAQSTVAGGGKATTGGGMGKDGCASDRERNRDVIGSDFEEGDTDEDEEEARASLAAREGKLYEEYIDEEERDRRQKLQSNQAPTTNYPCTICDRSFPLVQQLDLHMQNHDRIRSFSCSHSGCGRMFFNKYDLAKHTRTHLDYKPFTCIVCEKSFSREALLHRHEKVHSTIPKYVCSHCDQTFLNRDDFDTHVVKHKKCRPFQCRMCKKSFVFKQGLQRHESIHADEKPHKCNYCEASFTSPIKLMRHITSHAGLRPYPCKLCGRTFLLSHHLTRHLKSHYTGVGGPGADPPMGQHKCDVCSMSFRRKDSLINHSAIHSMVNLKCVICNTAFETATQVKHHITSHLSGLPYPCDMCDYSFDTQEQLEEHELKHAEMEYEEQIEAEVSKEAFDDMEADENEQEEPAETADRRTYKLEPVNQRPGDEDDDEDEEGVEDEEEDDDSLEEMTEFTITESGLVPVQRKKVRKYIDPIEHTLSTNPPYTSQQEVSTVTTTVDQQDIVLTSIHHHDSFPGPKISHLELALTTANKSLVSSHAHAQNQNHATHDDAQQQYVSTGGDAEVITPHPVIDVDQGGKGDTNDIIDCDSGLLDDKARVASEIRAMQKKGDTGHTDGQRLKDIVRTEGTKVYARKAPAQRYKPQMMAPPAATVAPLSQINQSTLDTLGLTQQEVNSMPTQKYVDMKVGDKTLRVKKLIMSKSEIAAMAKEGHIEMKGGNLILKKNTKGSLLSSRPMESTNKPSRISLENILDPTPKTIKQRIVTKKTYVKKSPIVPTSVTTAITNVNKDLTITPITSAKDVVNVDLTEEHIDLTSSNDLQSIEEVNL